MGDEYRKANGGSMGLKGVWAQIANTGAVAVLCLLFWQGQQEMLKNYGQDRRDLRRSLERIAGDNARLHEAMQENLDALRENQRVTNEVLRRLDRHDRAGPPPDPGGGAR